MTGLGRVVAVSTVLLTLVAACQKKLPTGPSDLAEGVIVYEHANFQGTSAHPDAKRGRSPRLQGAV